MASMRMLWWILLLPGVAAAQTFVDFTTSSGAVNASMYSTGAAPGDFDADGDVDLYVTNWGSGGTSANALYQNDGHAVFTDVAASRGLVDAGNTAAAAWCDFDNDGDLDLYVADFFEQDFLYANEGGAFTEVGRTRGTVNMIRQGAETCVGWGDYDGDGWSDLYVGKYYYANELYHNRGDGTFDLVTDLGVNDPRDTQAVEWIDYDGDGQLDLYVVNRDQANTLYHNSSGYFTEEAARLGVDDHGIGQDAAWGDYDADGDLDLLVANVGGNLLYRNEGAGGFVDQAGAAGVRHVGAGWITAACAWMDYDGDGDLDLFLASGGDRQYQPDALLANDGTGRFQPATAAGIPTNATAHTDVVWADLDDSGSPDLYITDGLGPWGGGSVLLLNQTDGNAFLRVGVRGGGPVEGGGSKDAIGAQIRLVDTTSGNLSGYRQVVRASGAPELFFGVSPGVTYRVEVQFPNSGRVATATAGPDLRGNETITVVESQPQGQGN